MDDTAPALDPAVLEALRQLTIEGEPDALREVLELFRTEAAARLEAVSAAVAAADAAAVQRAAHAFKGAAGTIGAARLQAACRRLEELGRSGTLTGAAAALEDVRREHAQVADAIAHLL